MSTLFVDRRDIALEHDSGALIIRDGGERIATVPLAPITRVVLRGNAQLTASLLATLGERGIGVLVLTGRQGKPSLFFGRPHNDARLRVEQTRRSLQDDFCLAYAQRLVQRKLERQCQWIDAAREHYPAQRYPLSQALRQLQEQLPQIAHTRRLDSLRGLEGAAASGYFAGLRAVVPASLGFHERNRRPPRDPFNALLSLTYTLAHAEAAFTLHAAGLDPCIGYYHQLSHSRESLACDIMETIRPLADRLCLKLVAQQVLTAEHFSQSDAGCLLGKAGRSRYYGAYEEHAQPLRHAVQQEVRSLRQRIAPDMPEFECTRPDYDGDIYGALADSSAEAAEATP
ncbi:MAG TPA: CRISPR-associated endonuclease Cas1 [Alicycliphilus sp.]|jgi:CRISPR-associated protein Cas1|uniref:CRISPR-associated endonuclease Cas1 n=1 Tax=Diaphorobacter limosus TaxID=3036128 RepID=A0ABZ0J0R2_9BURK|nr:CRISPR-associated endonuclease Cas1 [Diaphorobacter sp. Y-1]MBP7325634.1 CRISPR-associated endonuclease Cas1 [Alicycliphilus sp.]MCA0440860.1 CRISPR-associated endonuclease Cas1 [Pseudomonadota bacterium]TXJ17391.1 MAG: CRISPR-associated endonuclease Cas1 [Alicycliphilus sp.]WOO31127.1 CRISPR-associated endonuclease Cas1 [Diaphorobacter sp. Y-1]HPU18926.1 CRISPR-associated endonuclease Cas1 [Alicycliphilus sp.]